MAASSNWSASAAAYVTNECIRSVDYARRSAATAGLEFKHVSLLSPGRLERCRHSLADALVQIEKAMRKPITESGALLCGFRLLEETIGRSHLDQRKHKEKT